jgi:hypothetical protein
VSERNFMMGPLQANVDRRLSELTRSVDESDTESLAVLARAEIPLLVAALRETLVEHRPNVRGRCPVCRARSSRLAYRRRNTPCRAYLAAQLRLVQDESVAPSSTSHHRRRRRSPLFAG